MAKLDSQRTRYIPIALNVDRLGPQGHRLRRVFLCMVLIALAPITLLAQSGRQQQQPKKNPRPSFQRMQISRDLYNLARVEMNELAKTTGGRNFVAASLQDARAAFAQVATQIGTQYSLGYYPTNKARDGQFRTIRVELQGVQGEAQVRAREGYYAPKEK